MGGRPSGEGGAACARKSGATMWSGSGLRPSFGTAGFRAGTRQSPAARGWARPRRARQLARHDALLTVAAVDWNSPPSTSACAAVSTRHRIVGKTSAPACWGAGTGAHLWFFLIRSTGPKAKAAYTRQTASNFSFRWRAPERHDGLAHRLRRDVD